jgi:hypothetical protein
VEAAADQQPQRNRPDRPRRVHRIADRHRCHRRRHEPFVCVYNNQQQFTYNDKNGNLQDAWWDGDTNRWNLQQINNAHGNGATVPGEFMASPAATAPANTPFCVCVYNNQQHFTYVGGDGILQDVWWDGDANQWNLQQINNADGMGPAVPGEFIASPDAPSAGNAPLVCVYNYQQHFT